VVVDTSVLLAVFFNEKHGPWAADQLRENSHRLRMSTVNYAEALILIQDRQPHLFGEIRQAIEASTIRLVPPTAEQAEIAAAARLRYPLNLGDCFAYALAKHEQCPLLTLDRDFRRTDLTVVLPGVA
jgi:ribonuclease VapC